MTTRYTTINTCDICDNETAYLVRVAVGAPVIIAHRDMTVRDKTMTVELIGKGHAGKPTSAVYPCEEWAWKDVCPTCIDFPLSKMFEVTQNHILKSEQLTGERCPDCKRLRRLSVQHLMIGEITLYCWRSYVAIGSLFTREEAERDCSAVGALL